MDEGVKLGTLWLVLRSDSQEVFRDKIYETAELDEGNQAAALHALFYLGQAVARTLNCGVALDWIGDWLGAWPDAAQLPLPEGYSLLDTVQQSTRQYFFQTPRGIRVITEDEFAETVDPGTLLSRLHNELMPYDDPLTPPEV